MTALACQAVGYCHDPSTVVALHPSGPIHMCQWHALLTELGNVLHGIGVSS